MSQHRQPSLTAHTTPSRSWNSGVRGLTGELCAIRQYFVSEGYEPVSSKRSADGYLTTGILKQARIEKVPKGTVLSFQHGYDGPRMRFLIWDGWCRSGPLTHTTSGTGWAAFSFWVGTSEVNDIWEGDTPEPSRMCPVS